MSFSATQQGALYRARRRRLARVLLQRLTAWAPGQTVSAGDYVSSEAGTAAFVAGNSGVTGAGPAPSGPQASDGAITWTRADTQSLLRFAFVGLPTP